MRTTNTELGRLEGLLFFPVTAFTPEGSFDAAGYRAHVEARLADGPAAVFAACGTGEFPALAPAEYEECVRVAVEAAGSAGRRVPVLGGTGYGTALAVEYARAAQRAGAQGLLVFPPSGADGGQAGLAAHYRALAEATPLSLILYQRDQLAFTPQTVAELAAVPNIVGLKDGRGDLDLMQRIVSAVRTAGIEDFQYFNGMPTAEATQRAYRAIGVPLYSSAVFCFAPDIALAFHGALERGDSALLDRLVDVFFRPYVELRRAHPGYAVSLVKALTVAAGHPVGGVRAPLTEPDPAHVEAATALVQAAREALA
ncbi:5-dehydro-4-deoxyglucarate dehydratase [Actinocrinis puniceicyclus]|uniref:Probable 5-dehydro-4-deoxyglucarate dehydratase n=1 Tax=Actinocrinis puniceicyclus TaxID=977794 RepID=A0A8J7WNL2_9ACTN|nr:5-dehydro-4-deoxyglucarate dehydratase [Actinocrinis puniceicyclus]MBS2962719.1 5-dehydro-4-deoxyglucarate dehydratase [Actinocrinis puniceicyclus]